MTILRRHLIKGAAVTAALFVCEAAAKPVTDILIPRLGCGCPRIHELTYGHTCVVHDETGKRWDSYAIEDVAKACNVDFEPAQDDWHCYCTNCTKLFDNEMPVGTPCIWSQVSYEYDEWECECAESYRQQWLFSQTTDWVAMSKQMDP